MEVYLVGLCENMCIDWSTRVISFGVSYRWGGDGNTHCSVMKK